jgi:hypothetical protein
MYNYTKIMSYTFCCKSTTGERSVGRKESGMLKPSRLTSRSQRTFALRKVGTRRDESMP